MDEALYISDLILQKGSSLFCMCMDMVKMSQAPGRSCVGYCSTILSCHHCMNSRSANSMSFTEHFLERCSVTLTQLLKIVFLAARVDKAIQGQAAFAV